PGFSSRPLTTASPVIGWGLAESSFGSFSATSGSTLTTKRRAALPPWPSWTRSQRGPGVASGATGSVSWPFCLPAFASTPVPETQTPTGQRSKVPPSVTVTVVPWRPPAGERDGGVGGAAVAAVGGQARRRGGGGGMALSGRVRSGQGGGGGAYGSRS